MTVVFTTINVYTCYDVLLEMYEIGANVKIAHNNNKKNSQQTTVNKTCKIPIIETHFL